MSLLPLLAGFLIAALGTAYGQRPFVAAPSARSAWSGAATVGLAWLASYLVLEGGRWPWPPREAQHYLALAVPLASAAWWLAGAAERHAARAYVVQGMGLSVFLALALRVFLEHHWEGSERITRFASLLAGGLAFLACAAATGRRRGPAAPAAWLAAFVGAALALAQSWGSAALLLGALACVPGGALVTCLWRPERQGLIGASLPLAWVLGGLVLLGNHYAQLPWSAALLLLLATQAGWLARGGGTGRRSAWIPALVAGGLAAAAVRLSLVEPGPYGY